MGFNANEARAAAVKLAKATENGMTRHMVSRWDAQGSFVSGAEYHYDMYKDAMNDWIDRGTKLLNERDKLKKENEALRMLVADVLYGWLPEDAGPGFEWETWAEVASEFV